MKHSAQSTNQTHDPLPRHRQAGWARRPRHALTSAITGAVLVSTYLPFSATPARAAENDSAAALAAAISRDPSIVTGAEYVTVPPAGLTALASTKAVAGFPKHGDSFGILSSGVASALYFPGDPEEPVDDAESRGGGAIRGDTDRDVTILRIDVNLPSAVNCLTGVEFRFLSDEYPDYVGSDFNDAFIFEIDNNTWTTQGSDITSPANLAFDELGNFISINAAGAATMTSALAAGTTTGGSTRTLIATSPITAGPHSLYFSIFDQGDQILDSTVLLDNLSFGHVEDPETQCKPGITPVVGAVLTAPEPTFTDGANPSFTIPNHAKITYLIDGLPYEPGTYDATPGQSIVINAASGGDDLLQGPSSWSHTWPYDGEELIPVTPTAPSFTDSPGADNDSVTIPAKAGVTYYLNFEEAAAGVYPASGSVWVQAVANAGYVLSGPSEWTNYFETEGSQPETVSAPAPTADLLAGTFTIPASNQVDYLVNGASTDAGVHDGVGTITVEAQAAEVGVQLSGATTWSFTFPDSSGSVTIVVATAPTFTDSTSGPGTIGIPNVTGVNYRIGGETVAPGTYPGVGPVTVTASAAVGYAINGVTGWSHVFQWASSIQVSATPPTFTDPPGTDNDTFTVPSKLGVRYLLDGNVIPAGVYPVDPSSPTVTIAAVATAGYVLTGPSVFSHTFTTSDQLEFVVGTPTISGSAAVGASLTASAGEWTPTPTSLAYQWLADGNEIPGATGDSYTVASTDVGKQLAVKVTGTRAGYLPASATSASTAAVTAAALTTAVPIISGTAAVGSTLTAIPGAWGPEPVSFQYQWTRNGVPIDGATNVTYAVTTADAGAALAVVVTGSKPGYGSASRQSAAVQVAAPPPPAQGKKLTKTPTPKITGTAKVSQKLKAKPGTWKPAKVSLSYQWLRSGEVISGATGNSYVLVGADIGKKISVQVTGAKAGYQSVTKTSKQTKAVAPGSLKPVTPKISGVARVGSVLTAKAGTWKPAPVELSYQWYRSGKPIAGATQSSYLLVAGDIGKKITVRVTGSKPEHAKATKSSKATKRVAAAKIGSAVPTISGAATVGGNLVANPGTWVPAETTFKYQWLANGKSIKSATTSTYLVRAADRGKRIAVKVTGSSPGYAATSRTSAKTAKVT